MDLLYTLFLLLVVFFMLKYGWRQKLGLAKEHFDILCEILDIDRENQKPIWELIVTTRESIEKSKNSNNKTVIPSNSNQFHENKTIDNQNNDEQQILHQENEEDNLPLAMIIERRGLVENNKNKVELNEENFHALKKQKIDADKALVLKLPSIDVEISKKQEQTPKLNSDNRNNQKQEEEEEEDEDIPIAQLIAKRNSSLQTINHNNNNNNKHDIQQPEKQKQPPQPQPPQQQTYSTKSKSKTISNRRETNTEQEDDFEEF